MSKNVLIYMSGLSVPVEGKMMAEKGKTSLLFSNENGRYYVTIENNSVHLSLTGEVGYSLTLQKGKLTYLSLAYGGTKTFPSPVTTETLNCEIYSTYGKIDATYSLSDNNVEYDGCEDDEDVQTQSFSLSWKIK
jgi:hypothetical protein